MVIDQQKAVIAVANQKGGVAKTTTAINLGASLAIAGQRVLLVDLDPQGNLTSGLGLKDQAAASGTTYEALVSDEGNARDFVLKSGIDLLSVMPANRNLTGAEIELVSLEGRERRLARLLDQLRPDFDFIFVDSPPSLGLLTLNALVAADSVLIPLNCEYFALEGIAELTSTIERVRSSLNPGLSIEGVLLTMYDDRTNLGQQVSSNIREFFGDRVYETVIPRNIRLGEAPSHGVPVLLYDPRSRGADAYVALAHEVLARRSGAHPSSDTSTAPPAEVGKMPEAGNAASTEPESAHHEHEQEQRPEPDAKQNDGQQPVQEEPQQHDASQHDEAQASEPAAVVPAEPREGE